MDAHAGGGQPGSLSPLDLLAAHPQLEVALDRQSRSKGDLMGSFHWEVDLQGPANALQALARDFTAGKVRVSADATQSKHILQMDSFERCSTDREVTVQTREFLPTLSGALALTLGTAPDLRMGAICRKHDDGRTDYFLEAETGALHAECGVVAAVATVTGPDGKPVVRLQPPSPAVKMVDLALTSPMVAKALRLWWADSADWDGLYRIWEVIENAAGGGGSTVAAGWTSNNGRTRFKRTACSVGAAGDKARHGVESEAPPPNPMKLEEGRAYVEDLLRRLLSSLGA